MSQPVPQPKEWVVAPSRVRWTRALVEELEKAGVRPSDRYELIQGELIRTSGQTRAVVTSETYLIHWLLDTFGTDKVLFHVGIDLEISDKEINLPEADGAVFKSSVESITADYPSSDTIETIFEVAGETLAFDLSTKAGLYARAGIVEYWVIDVTGRALTVHRGPEGGAYRSVVRYAADEQVATLAQPDDRVMVSRLLPPVAASDLEG
jgi:Uma2 family endonuclease